MKRGGLAVAIAVSALLHGALVVALLWEDDPASAERPESEAVPVELVLDMPDVPLAVPQDGEPEALEAEPSDDPSATGETAASETGPPEGAPEETPTDPEDPPAATQSGPQESRPPAPPQPATEDGARAGAAATEMERSTSDESEAAPASPVPRNVGTPETLYGDPGAAHGSAGSSPSAPAEGDGAGDGRAAAADAGPDDPAAPQRAQNGTSAAASGPVSAETDEGVFAPAGPAADGERPSGDGAPSDEPDRAPAAPGEAVPGDEEAAPRNAPPDEPDEPDGEPGESAAPPPTLSPEALRAALDSAARAAGEGGDAAGAQVGYTDAVRSAIAPGFFAAARTVAGSGTVIVEVVIRRDGSVRSADIVRSSGNTALDAASLSAARSAPYPPLPPAIEEDPLTIHIPLRVR